MAVKKISDLTSTSIVNDTDLLVIETDNGTRSIKVNSLLEGVTIDTDTKISDVLENVRVKTCTVTLASASWSETDDDIFTQTITISGITANSKVDLQPDSTVINQMLADGTYAIYIENNNGTLTAYALGVAPTVNLSIQATVTEVGVLS